MNKHVRIGLVALLLLALVGGVWKSFTAKNSATSASATAAADSGNAPAALQKVRLLTGSAKFGFLKDPELTKLLADNGLELELAKTGAYANDVGRAKDFDAVWPAGAAAAKDFSTAWSAPTTFQVFSTPLAIASWKPLMPVLEANGLGKLTGAAHGEFQMAKALPLMLKSTRWNQLKDNSVFSVNRGLLVNTPDVRQSTTGGLFVSLMAYIRNNDEVPADVETARQLALELSPLITRQGFQEGTLAGPFEDYLGQGMGKAPLVLIYESQFVEAKRQGKLQANHVLLYPQPGLVLKHVLVARNEPGKRLGELLANNPQAQKIAAQYGFRTNDAKVFAAAMKDVQLDAPELLNVADAPSTAIFDAINKTLVNKLEGTN